MSKYILPLIFLMFSVQVISQGKKAGTEMIFKETLHNFGTIWHKNKAVYEFTFKNTGKLPLVIKKVQSSCGCTVTEWEKEPVAPKGKGKIRVKYDTKRIGQFRKTIKIYSNAVNSPVTLLIIGAVKVTD